ncbi:hypothetical protein [Aureliella helgolandensis]|uniref:DUF3352 domain-containing protein n=1 Tax=Aureliella helgolandensis TaxID=2527968 RepID=A0A518GDG1_9BACT|nr:hypothetical protein [Aureliella helgolandensis]QDV26645.1 hypothetical protein Q31a_50210 [Aureliella helgolandensis]
MRQCFRKIQVLAILVTLWMAHATVGVATAQEVATGRLTAPKLFPEKTLAYLRVDDVKQLREDLSNSMMGKLGNDEQLKPILMEFYGSFVRATERMQDVFGLNLDEVLSIPNGELAIALLPKDRGIGKLVRNDDGDRVRIQSDRPAVVLLLDAGAEITSVQILLKRMDESIDPEMAHTEKEVDRLTLHRYAHPNRRDQQFAYFIDNGVMVASSDSELVEQLAGAWITQQPEWKTLSENRKFTSIMSRSVGTEGERPQISFYADPMAIVREFLPRDASGAMVKAVLPALGLDGIEAVGGSSIIGPPDFDSITHMHLLLSSPRRAVLSLVRPKSGATAPEAWVPDTVASYMTLNWDWSSTVEGVERLYNQFRGEDALQQQVFERMNERLGLDVRKDILENLEGRVTMLQGFVRPVRINSGSNVYAIRLKNPEYFKNNVLPKLLESIPERVEVQSETYGELKVNVVLVGRAERFAKDGPIRRPEICIAMIDDYVVISDSRYMMQQLASRVNGSVGKLSDSLEYQLISDRISAQLQDKECSGISFARPEETLQLFYELARDPKNRERLKGMAGGNPFFQSLVNALEKQELPPFSVISKYLAPSGGFLVEEETGLHYMTFSLRRD